MKITIKRGITTPFGAFGGQVFWQVAMLYQIKL